MLSISGLNTACLQCKHIKICNEAQNVLQKKRLHRVKCANDKQALPNATQQVNIILIFITTKMFTTFKGQVINCDSCRTISSL